MLDPLTAAALRRAHSALDIALSARRQNRAPEYSLARAIGALGVGMPVQAEHEYETSEKLIRQGGRLQTGNGLIVPFEALAGRRDIAVATSGGEYLVEDPRPLDVVDAVRPHSVVGRMGVQSVRVGPGGSVPRETAAPVGGWHADEASGPDDETPMLAALPLVPRTVSAGVKLSRQIMLQGVNAEPYVKRSLSKAIGAAVDSAVLGGSGVDGQPQGIIGATGIGSFTGTGLDLAALLNAQADTGDNLDETSGGYVTTRAVATLLAARQAYASSAESPLWAGNLLRGTLAGFRAISTSACPAASMLFAGTWSDVLVASFGPGIEVAIDPSSGFQRGVIEVRAFLTLDVAIVRPASFSVTSSIT